jgi:hypothetical protein
MASLFRSGILLPPTRNKKVGFRPLFAFDNFSIPWEREQVIRALVVIRSNYMVTDDILALLIQERDKLNRAIEALQGARRRGRPPKVAAAAASPAATGPAKRRARTPAQRKAQAKRMREYWAKRKKAEGK